MSQQDNNDNKTPGSLDVLAHRLQVQVLLEFVFRIARSRNH